MKVFYAEYDQSNVYLDPVYIVAATFEDATKLAVMAHPSYLRSIKQLSNHIIVGKED